MSNEFQNLATEPIQDSVGFYGTPEWTSITNARLITGPWTLFYRMRHIGEVDNVNFQTGAIDTVNPDGTFAETTGVDTTADTVVTAIDPYYVHTLSVRYEQDTWAATVGFENITDEQPPVLDENVPFTGGPTNVPLGSGYDIFGRTLFINVEKEF